MRIFRFLIAVMIIASPAFAATVSGVVTDATGAVVPGARSARAADLSFAPAAIPLTSWAASLSSGMQRAADVLT